MALKKASEVKAGDWVRRKNFGVLYWDEVKEVKTMHDGEIAFRFALTSTTLKHEFHKPEIMIEVQE